jgi:hypothetical protein
MSQGQRLDFIYTTHRALNSRGVFIALRAESIAIAEPILQFGKSLCSHLGVREKTLFISRNPRFMFIRPHFDSCKSFRFSHSQFTTLLALAGVTSL